MIFHKINDSKKYRLNLDTADKTLQNIFEACEQSPNHIPLQILASQRAAIVRPITIMICICHVVLFAVLLLPFILNQHKYDFITYNNYDTFYVKEHYAEENNVFIRVNMDKVNLSNCYIIDSEGKKYPARDFNTVTNTFTFPLYNDFGDIYLCDESDHTLHLLLTTQ